LTQYAVIAAEGADAVQFLHSQLTNDIKSLSENHACLAGYCSTKGRLLATLLVWKTAKTTEETVFLELPAELQESFQKRLQVYVMRSKVTLSHITGSTALLGILGNAAALQLAEWFPSLPTTPYESVHNEAGILIRLADAQDMPRYQWVMNQQVCEQIWPTLSEKLPILPEHIWSLSEIHAGIPHILLATQEKFVPQMVNYELIGGVNFKKGCYPGQEIVARSQYLGKQKRRMVLAQIDNAIVQEGTEIFAIDDESQPCGMIVNAQPNEFDGSDCLVEIKTISMNDGVVRLRSGEVCRWLDMPYSLPSGE
jgi:folate-binding protein YgfZ